MMIMFSCGKLVFIYSCSKVSSSSADVASVAVITFDSLDNISSVARFELFLNFRNDSSHSFGGTFGYCDPFWFEQCCGHFRYIFDVEEYKHTAASSSGTRMKHRI